MGWNYGAPRPRGGQIIALSLLTPAAVRARLLVPGLATSACAMLGSFADVRISARINLERFLFIFKLYALEK